MCSDMVRVFYFCSDIFDSLKAKVKIFNFVVPKMRSGVFSVLCFGLPSVLGANMYGNDENTFPHQDRNRPVVPFSYGWTVFNVPRWSLENPRSDENKLNLNLTEPAVYKAMDLSVNRRESVAIDEYKQRKYIGTDESAEMMIEGEEAYDAMPLDLRIPKKMDEYAFVNQNVSDDQPSTSQAEREMLARECKRAENPDTQSREESKNGRYAEKTVRNTIHITRNSVNDNVNTSANGSKMIQGTRPKMTRAVLDCIDPNTCSATGALFYWFGLPIRDCDLSYAIYLPAGYYLSMKGVNCLLCCKLSNLMYQSNQSISPVRINIVRDDYSGQIPMDMNLKNNYGRAGIVCQDTRCLEYILSVFASPLFRGEYFHVITGIYLREREGDEADIYSLEKPKKALDRRASVTKSEDRVNNISQLPKTTIPIYTKTFFAPVLAREGNKSVLCILLIHFERPPLKKDEIRADMSDEEKNKVYDIVHRPHKLVSATLIRFDDIENESEQSEECKSVRSMLHDAINTTEYKKAKEYFESVDWDDKAVDTLSRKSTGGSVSSKPSEDRDTVREELVLVPEENAESHFFIRTDPESIEKCHMLHEYNRDMETYVLVLKRKGNGITDTDNTEVTALMFLNPGKQFNKTDIKRKRRDKAKNKGLVQFDMLWYVYESIWKKMKSNQACGDRESCWMVCQQAYYTPYWCTDYPKVYELEVERYSKEKIKKRWKYIREKNDMYKIKIREQKRAAAIANGMVPEKKK